MSEVRPERVVERRVSVRLDAEEIRIVLAALRPAGGGYSADVRIARMQTALSLGLAVAMELARRANADAAGAGVHPPFKDDGTPCGCLSVGCRERRGA